MIYNLFLDDERFPKDVTWIQLPDLKWTVVRTYDAFVNIITNPEYGMPEICSFDHDLGPAAYNEYFSMVRENRTNFDYNKLTEKTGYDCAKFLAQYCIDRNIPIPLYYVHSMNPIGCSNIKSILESARKVLNNAK